MFTRHGEGSLRGRFAHPGTMGAAAASLHRLLLLRRLLLTLLVLAVLAPLALAAFLFFRAVQDEPLVARTAEITPANIERARRILARHDPRQARPNALRTITIEQEDLDLAANYGARRYAQGAAEVRLRQGGATVRATLTLPPNPAGRYLNLATEWRDTPGLPQLQRLEVGRVHVPRWAADWLLRRGVAWLQGDTRYHAAADAVRSVQTGEGIVQVIYEWKPEQLRAALVPAAEQERLLAYQARLAEFTRHAGTITQRLTVAELLQPLFELAVQRSAGGAVAAEESRAALVVLAFYINGKGLEALVPAAATQGPRAAARRITLAGRRDLAQHFSISAALAATAGSPLSDAVGLYKEIEDSRGGSGFSFIDLAADRAGTRFGELATGKAPALQQRAAAGLRENDFMPLVRDLPEFLQQAEFQRRFGDTKSAAYLGLARDIERRIATLPLYR